MVLRACSSVKAQDSCLDSASSWFIVALVSPECEDFRLPPGSINTIEVGKKNLTSFSGPPQLLHMTSAEQPHF